MTIKTRATALFMVAVMGLTLPACMIHEHQIGKGGDMRNSPKLQQSQFYLIGMRIGTGPEPTVTELASGKSDFTIRTSFNVLGAIVGVLTSGIFSVRNVEIYYE